MRFLEDMPRFVFFTGKGGVGKTSLACATAVHLAGAGRRVLLVSTDPASNVGQVFDQPIGNRVTPVVGVEGLDALEIDPESAAEQYRERILGPVRAALPASEIASLTEQLSGSCTTEIASFNEFTGFLAEEDSHYDHVVFDTAPTGHTIRLLQLPGDWTGFIDSGGDASCLGPMSGLDKHRDQYARALAALTDPTTTRLVLVARAQATSLAEAERTASELAGIGIHATHLVVNAVLPADGHPDPLAAATRARETAVLAAVAGPLADLPQDRIPLKTVNMVGVLALRALLSPEDTAEAPTDAAPLPAGGLPGLDALVDELAAIGHGLVMCVGKGGVGKTTIAAALAVGLAARGHRVHLTTTDPAAHLDATVTETPDLPSLTLSRVDPAQAIADYRAHVMATQGQGLDADALAALAEDLQSPCHQEIAVFQQFSSLVGQARRQFVVMDTAPTGHTLLLMDTTGAYHRDTVKTMAAGVRFTTPLMRLQDPDYTRLVMVTLPEPTPVLEAMAFRDDLARAGITPWAWVINQSLTAARPTAPLLLRRARLETDPIDTVTKTAARVAVVPVLLDEPVGAARLLALTDTHTMTGSTP